MRRAATGLVAAAILAGVASGSASPTHSRTCFPARSWSDPQRFRPCVRILRVEEDGSFFYRVEDADGTVRYSAGVGALDR